jgi:hypothetical protein
MGHLKNIVLNKDDQNQEVHLKLNSKSQLKKKVF